METMVTPIVLESSTAGDIERQDEDVLLLSLSRPDLLTYPYLLSLLTGRDGPRRRVRMTLVKRIERPRKA